jgi:uncharacterized protein (TIGR03083 family)
MPPSPPIDAPLPVRAYRELMGRVVELVADVDDEAATRVAPATPAWTVHDLLAHLVGVTADAVNGRLTGVGTDEWTAVQVAERRDRSVAELLAEWESHWPAFSERLGVLATASPARAGQAVFDATTHEHDLRGALGRPGARRSAAADLAWEWAAGIVGQLRDGRGAGALVLRTSDDGAERVAGTGEATGAVAAERFDLWRAMTGRRSAGQVRSWAWDGELAVADLCFFPARDTDLVE